MNADQTLQTLRKSLEPKPQPKLQEKQESVTLTDALLKIPELTGLMKQVLAVRQREVDILKVIEQVDFDIQKLVSQSSKNLAKTDSINTQLADRLKQFDLMEAKYNNLIIHVDNVLNELERVLKNF